MISRYVVGDLVVDLQERWVRRANVEVALPDLSFGVLAELIRNYPKPVKAHALALAVWSTEHVSDETIAQRIRLLRRALNDNPREPTYIKTIRGAGYACHAAVRPDVQVRSRMPGRLSIGLAALALVAAGTVSIFWGMRAGPHNVDTPDNLRPRDQAPSLVAGLLDRAGAELQVQQSEETDRAIELLQHALGLEPNNQAVHIGLSFALSTRVTKFRARADDTATAEALARRAVGAQPQDGSAWHALGYSLDSQGRVDEALSAYQRAFQLNPTDVAAMSSAAYLLGVRGQLFQSLLLEAQAMQGDRTSRYAETQFALVLDLLDHAGAARWRARAHLLNPNQVVVLAEMVESLLRRGQPDAALEVLGGVEGPTGDNPRLLRLGAQAALAAGQPEQARARLLAAGEVAQLDLAALDGLFGTSASASQQLEQARHQMLKGDSWPGLRVELARLHAALGDDEAALRLLSQAVDLGWRDVGSVEHSPFFQTTVLDPGWAPVRQRIERELAMQKALVTDAAMLSWVLEVAPGD